MVYDKTGTIRKGVNLAYTGQMRHDRHSTHTVEYCAFLGADIAPNRAGKGQTPQTLANRHFHVARFREKAQYCPLPPAGEGRPTQGVPGTRLPCFSKPPHYAPKQKGRPSSDRSDQPCVTQRNTTRTFVIQRKPSHCKGFSHFVTQVTVVL